MGIPRLAFRIYESWRCFSDNIMDDLCFAIAFAMCMGKMGRFSNRGFFFGKSVLSVLIDYVVDGVHVAYTQVAFSVPIYREYLSHERESVDHTGLVPLSCMR